VGEFHALIRQALHVRRAVMIVKLGSLGIERHGCVLPAHVIDEEYHNIGPRRCVVRAGRRGPMETGSQPMPNTTAVEIRLMVFV